MRVSAVVSLVEERRWLAQCEEVDRAGEGATADEAIASLHEALEEYFSNAEAIAPPPQPPREAIEIIVVDAPHPHSRRRQRAARRGGSKSSSTRRAR